MMENADSGCASHGLALQPNVYKSFQPPKQVILAKSNIGQGEASIISKLST
jgi:hypothetical protein